MGQNIKISKCSPDLKYHPGPDIRRSSFCGKRRPRNEKLHQRYLVFFQSHIDFKVILKAIALYGWKQLAVMYHWNVFEKGLEIASASVLRLSNLDKARGKIAFSLENTAHPFKKRFCALGLASKFSTEQLSPQEWAREVTMSLTHWFGRDIAMLEDISVEHFSSEIKWHFSFWLRVCTNLVALIW